MKKISVGLCALLLTLMASASGEGNGVAFTVDPEIYQEYNDFVGTVSVGCRYTPMNEFHEGDPPRYCGDMVLVEVNFYEVLESGELLETPRRTHQLELDDSNSEHCATDEAKLYELKREGVFGVYAHPSTSCYALDNEGGGETSHTNVAPSAEWRQATVASRIVHSAIPRSCAS